MKTFMVVEGAGRDGEQGEKGDVRSFEVIGREVHGFMVLMLIKGRKLPFWIEQNKCICIQMVKIKSPSFSGQVSLQLNPVRVWHTKMTQEVLDLQPLWVVRIVEGKDSVQF